jgi:hypothetical protein
MEKLKRKLIYLSNKEYDGTVYTTQVIDWLHLYAKEGLNFDLIQLSHIKDISRRKHVSDQVTKIKNCTHLHTSFSFYFPSKGIFLYLNVFNLYFLLLKYLFSYQEILIFSRGIFGKEISLLKKLFPNKILFYYDARAASAEENKYNALKQGDFSLKKYTTIANIYYTEYKTLQAANKIFAVSTVLQNYFESTFRIDPEKFVLYPCLSDTSKFYYNEELRETTRTILGFKENAKVFLYAGGVSGAWHISNKLFEFFNSISLLDENSRFLFLTKDHLEINKMLLQFPILTDKLLNMSVKNEDMVKYLNASDYGILFRENTIMNNVASPSKFAEYILTGLPVLISDGVGDYTDFTRKFKVGQVIKENNFENMGLSDLNTFMSTHLDRKSIAELGIRYLSKESILPEIIKQFKN